MQYTTEIIKIIQESEKLTKESQKMIRQTLKLLGKSNIKPSSSVS